MHFRSHAPVGKPESIPSLELIIRSQVRACPSVLARGSGRTSVDDLVSGERTKRGPTNQTPVIRLHTSTSRQKHRHGRHKHDRDIHCNLSLLHRRRFRRSRFRVRRSREAPPQNSLQDGQNHVPMAGERLKPSTTKRLRNITEDRTVDVVSS